MDVKPNRKPREWNPDYRRIGLHVQERIAELQEIHDRLALLVPLPEPGATEVRIASALQFPPVDHRGRRAVVPVYQGAHYRLDGQVDVAHDENHFTINVGRVPPFLRSLDWATRLYPPGRRPASVPTDPVAACLDALRSRLVWLWPDPAEALAVEMWQEAPHGPDE